MYYNINEETAKRAKEMSSYDDYKENSETQGYKNTVDEIISYAEEQKKRCRTEEAKERIDNLVLKFSKNYADWVNRYNEIKCYCPSILITGGGNFPTRKKQKQIDMLDNHMKKYNEIMNIESKIRSIANGSYVIKSSDDDAITRLEEKIKAKENCQQRMKEQNAYYRKHKTMVGYADLDDEEAKRIDSQIKSDPLYHNTPNPPFYLSNNNQEIRRLKLRLEQLKKDKQEPTQEYETDYFEVVENKELMRLQLIFEGVPDQKTREILKHYSFRWSPKNSCWQRQLTNNAKYALKAIIKTLDEYKAEPEQDN